MALLSPYTLAAMGSGFYGAQNFEPKFFTGGPTRFYLPLFFDVVVQEKPALIVTLGLSDAQAHLAFSQAVAEQNLASRCVAVRRARANESAIDDPAWQYAEKTTTKFFANISQLVEADAIQAAADFADGSIEVLLIDDVDSGETVRQELDIWGSKLSAKALVLLHGTSLERQDSPRTAWLNFVIGKAAAYFGEGIGLSVATERAAAKASPFRTALFDETTALAQGYRLIAESIRARAQTRQAERRARFFEARQTLFDTIVEDRTKAQSVIDYQERCLTDFNRKFDAINADRAEAQLIMNDQFARIQKMHAKMTEQKQVLAVAKATCRNKGRCFVVPKEPKPQRSLKERVSAGIHANSAQLKAYILHAAFPTTKENLAQAA